MKGEHHKELDKIHYPGQKKCHTGMLPDNKQASVLTLHLPQELGYSLEVSFSLSSSISNSQ